MLSTSQGALRAPCCARLNGAARRFMALAINTTRGAYLRLAALLALVLLGSVSSNQPGEPNVASLIRQGL